jgi:DNA-binding PadR family transcriptional regulator
MSKKEQKTFSQCPCVGETLDKLVQPAMLAILARGSLHGYELARKVAGISHFSDDAPDLSGVYRALKSLETRGMVTSSWDTPQEGRPKRLFAITDEGRQCLGQWETTLKHYHRAVGSLLKTVQKAVR